ALASAASKAWGQGWLESTGLTIREPGPILTSAQAAPDVGAHEDRGSSTVRPAVVLRTGPGQASAVVLNDLMPLRQAPVEVPAFPRLLTAVAAAAALLATVFGLLGVGAGGPSGGAVAGAVRVDGRALGGAAIPVDLDRPIPVEVDAALLSGPPPSGVAVTLSLAGYPVAHSTSGPMVRHGGELTTMVDLSSGRYIAGGSLRATVELSGPGTAARTASFTLAATRSPFASLAGIVAVAALLLVAAYAESTLRALRRGRRREQWVTVGGVGLVGAAAGITASLWGWLLGAATPTGVSTVLAAAIGLVAGLLAGEAARRVGRRARARRRANRLVLLAKRGSSGEISVRGTGS
ncbi:MAG TPA: hypothetical protein VL961_01270, partial [Acidimicrobiales bacterium]|nr:hypothetical protein [Acidimicrobiales bacterium]